jgi:hypothetical protein
MPDPLATDDRKACQVWEVDAITTGPIASPFTLVVIRPLSAGESKVVATSRDMSKMDELLRSIEKDLSEMDCATFAAKYALSLP